MSSVCDYCFYDGLTTIWTAPSTYKALTIWST